MEPNAPGSEAADVTPAPRFDTASPDGGLPCRPNSRPNPPPASSGRGGKGAGRPPAGPLFCQVEGCAAPLEGLKDYHQRYRVCEVHLKIDYIVRDGAKMRFCQQCGRYQPLEDFDGDKRSCRERLERHNARRRKRPRSGDESGAPAGDAALPPGSCLPRELQEALQLASALAAAMGGGEGGAPGSSPVTPTPDVMLTLLKVYAAMFHYELESAVLRPLRPPTDLGPGEPIDAATVHQLLAQQGASGGGGAPAPPPQPPPRLQRPQQAQRQSLQPQQRQTQVQQQLWMTPDPPASLVVHTPIQPPDPGLVAAAVAAAMAAGREITTEEIAALTGLQ